MLAKHVFSFLTAFGFFFNSQNKIESVRKQLETTETLI